MEDPETGEIYSEPVSAESADREEAEEPHAPTAPGPEYAAGIPLETLVSYSLDNKNWRNGRSSRVSYGWILLELPEQDKFRRASLALQIHLPFQEGKEPVWVISRVYETTAGDRMTKELE